MPNQQRINWWRTEFGKQEIASVVTAMENECISQGKITAEFEQALADFLGVKHVIAVTSGSAALMVALMAAGVGPGDEVIMPCRTWVATAHAAHLLGAKVILVDVEDNRPIIDASKIEAYITARTKVILPVHMNGRSADMLKIKAIAKKHNVMVIEDAAQGFASKNAQGYLGTQSHIGCFSLSVAKTISTGQGGFTVTNNDKLADNMRAIRTHGVENVKDPKSWVMAGFNFRFTDIQAAIGIEQLKKIEQRVAHLTKLYQYYQDELKSSAFQLIPVNLSVGEVPVYIEYLVENRDLWIDKLAESSIETRPFYPSLDKAEYLLNTGEYKHSQQYEDKGIYLPSGPTQSIEGVRRVINVIGGAA